MTSFSHSPMLRSRSWRLVLVLVSCFCSALLLVLYEDSPWSRHDYIEGNPHVPFSGFVSQSLLLPVASLVSAIVGPESTDRLRAVLSLIIWMAIARTTYESIHWTLGLLWRVRGRWGR
jgi:hypothetical protein